VADYLPRAAISGRADYSTAWAATSRSAIVHGFRVISAAIAGVMRMLLCIRQKL
jgi:hypothetical protein